MGVTHLTIPFLNITQAVSHTTNNSRLDGDYTRSCQVSALWGILSEEAEPQRSLSRKKGATIAAGGIFWAD